MAQGGARRGEANSVEAKSVSRTRFRASRTPFGMSNYVARDAMLSIDWMRRVALAGLVLVLAARVIVMGCGGAFAPGYLDDAGVYHLGDGATLFVPGSACVGWDAAHASDPSPPCTSSDSFDPACNAWIAERLAANELPLQIRSLCFDYGDAGNRCAIFDVYDGSTGRTDVPGCGSRGGSILPIMAATVRDQRSRRQWLHPRRAAWWRRGVRLLDRRIFG